MSHKIITIGRQYGSGGHEIGEKLAKSLNIPLYDRNLIEMAAEKMGMPEGSVEEVDETALNTFFAGISIPSYPNSVTGYGLPLTDSTYLAQSSIIEMLAKQGPCIIIGRCADYILKDVPGCVHIFICADIKDRICRIMERYSLPKKEAVSAIKRVDRRRKSYYEFYTDRKWGSVESHQLLLNVSALGINQTLGLIKYLYEYDGTD